jgi:eukaryotic-like serine/threonine-protein kinase
VHTQGSLLDGRYRVIRHLGSGGMASVLLCEDERLGRHVAVKRLHADSPRDVEQRFNREAKLGASLNHPNLVSVFDTATDDEGVLIVMEFVEGEPLSRLLRRGPLRPEEVCGMVCDLGDALDHVHAQGIVHRDVKPGNVLIRHDGVTKLVDLGIATAADISRITRSGVVLGTAAYMAPEQLEGKKVGPATDVYSLAAIAFEALSGRKPREGRSPMEIAHKIATDGPPDLRDAWSRAPAKAARMLQRGMAREPARRPASAGELADELADALRNPPAETAPSRRFVSRPPPAPVPAAAPARADDTAGDDPAPTAAPMRRARAGRRPGLPAILLALVFVALAIAAVTGSLLSGGDDQSSSSGADRTPVQPRQREPAKKQKKGKKESKAEQSQGAPANAAPTAPAAPAEEAPASSSASGAELNAQGFALMNQGRYADAVPILEQAVESFPKGTTDLNYAYALYNLGKSLRLAGEPDKAIPILEQRLKIPNQTETVRRELELAKQQAKQG